MTTLANQSAFSIHACAVHTLTGVTIALATCSHRNIRNGIKVGFEYLSIAEEFVAECIKTIESDAYVGSSYPFLGKERESWVI